MTMNHGSTDAPGAVMSDCANCHPNSKKSGFFPGAFHDSLNDMSMPQPTSCSSCHLDAMPTGLVGPTATNPARTPPTGEMRHDAVGWVSTAPTNARIVPTNCGICHRVSDNRQVTWASGKGGGHGPVPRSLNNAGHAQPTSCMDCHANSRPQGASDQDQRVPAGRASRSTTPRRSATGDCASLPRGHGGAVVLFVEAGSVPPPARRPADLPALSRRRAADVDPTAGSARRTRIRRSTTGPTLPARPTATARIARSATPGRAPARGAAARTGRAATSTTARRRTRRRPASPATRRSGPTCSRARRQRAVRRRSGSTTRPRRGRVHRLPRGDDQGRPVRQLHQPVDAHVAGRRLAGAAVAYPGSTFSGSSDQFINVTEMMLGPRRHGRSNNVLRATTITDTIYNGMLHTSPILPALAVGRADQRARPKQVLALPHPHATARPPATTTASTTTRSPTSARRRRRGRAVPAADHQLQRLPFVHDARRHRRAERLQPVADGSQGGARHADHGRRCDGGAGVGSRLLVLPQEPGQDLGRRRLPRQPAVDGGGLRLQRLPLPAHVRCRGSPTPAAARSTR